LLVFSSGLVMSQPPPPPPPPDPTSGPIDSGSLFLLAAAGCYGYLQLRKKEVALSGDYKVSKI
jgi:hypothetical protein